MKPKSEKERAELETILARRDGEAFGMGKAWLLAGEIANLPASVREALFGNEDLRFIFRLFSAEEALTIMAAYEKED